MKKYILRPKYLALFYLLIPFFSMSQGETDLKIKSASHEKDSVIISKYLQKIESSRSNFNIMSKNYGPIKLNFNIPRFKIYNAADYYADGRFACYPFNSWGPYQVENPMKLTTSIRSKLTRKSG